MIDVISVLVMNCGLYRLKCFYNKAEYRQEIECFQSGVQCQELLSVGLWLVLRAYGGT